MTGFTTALNTTSPNNTVNVSSIAASGGTSIQDVALVPKGGGAMLAQVPDNTATAGNRRGQNAVDLQTFRSSATAVANGQYACIPGGQNNTASGNNSFAMGSSNTASGTNSVAMGGAATASMQNAVAIGSSVTASGSYSFATGHTTTASGHYSRTGGSYATTRGVQNADAFGVRQVALGYAQRAIYMGSTSTPDATPKAITADSSAASATNQIPISGSYGASAVRVMIAARKSGSSADCKFWEVTLGARRDTSAASTALVGTINKTFIAASAGASTWDVDVTADTTNGCLTVTATGQAATSIAWIFKAETVEIENAP